VEKPPKCWWRSHFGIHYSSGNDFVRLQDSLASLTSLGIIYGKLIKAYPKEKSFVSYTKLFNTVGGS
jgi:hypothetical protein